MSTEMIAWAIYANVFAMAVGVWTSQKNIHGMRFILILLGTTLVNGLIGYVVLFGLR